MRFREDNRGLSLIEIMLSMALLTIIMGCLILMMSSAGKNFARGSIQAKLQEEAQDAANYLTDTIISSNYAIVNFGGAVEYIILNNNDKEDVEDGTIDPAVSPYKAFVKVGREMYFYSVNDAAGAAALDNVINGGAVPSKYNLLCSNVESFTASYTKTSKHPKPVVDYTITLKIDNPNMEFSVSNSVAMRNMTVSIPSPGAIPSPGGI